MAGVVVSVPEGLKRFLSPVQFWSAMERNIPRALLPVAVEARRNAPRGETGKLTRQPFEIRTRRRFALGTVIEAAIGSKVPYGHLPERGHRIVARGPTRKGKRLSRARRRELRAGLLERRTQLSRGMVPGQFFTRRALESQRPQVIQRLEKLLALEFIR